MRLTLGLVRPLVFLLVVRAIIAPYTVRSLKTGPMYHPRVVMSVRTWPPQRLERFSATSKVLKLFKGKDKVDELGSSHSSPSILNLRALQFATSLHANEGGRVSTWDRSVNCPRC